MLFERRGAHGLGFDVGGYVQRTDAGELQRVPFTPAEELSRRLDIGGARVLVADVGREEFQEVLAGLCSRISNDGRHRDCGSGQRRQNFSGRSAHALPIQSVNVEALYCGDMTESRC